MAKTTVRDLLRIQKSVDTAVEAMQKLEGSAIACKAVQEAGVDASIFTHAGHLLIDYGKLIDAVIDGAEIDWPVK